MKIEGKVFSVETVKVPTLVVLPNGSKTTADIDASVMQVTTEHGTLRVVSDAAEFVAEDEVVITIAKKE